MTVSGSDRTALTITSPADEPVIIMTRTFDAPRTLVWSAMTEARHVANWWGPRSVAIKVVKLDLRPGGEWRVEHSMPDGTTYVLKGRYLEVVAPEKLVNTFGMEGMFEGREIVETHTLEEVEGKTRYTSVSRFDSIADRDGMLASGMEEGARESLDRLAELLETLEPKI